MALREIGAKLTLDGEAEWNSQMKAVDRELKNVKAELVANTAKFNGHANSMDALRAKSKLLEAQQAQQVEKVRALREAMEAAARQYGDSAAETDKLRQSLAYAEAATAKTGDAIEKTSQYLEEAASSTDGCATSIDGYGKQTKQAAEANDGLLGKLNKLVPGLDLTAAKGALTGAALAAAFQKAWNWAMQLVEETRELRDGLSKLEVSAQSAGVAFDDDLNAALQNCYEQTGDFDSAMEALSNLLAAGYSGEGLTETIRQLSGLVIQFPDTLKLEGLADSLQETIATGSATGQLSEAYGRVGGSVDELNDSLADCNTTAERQDAIFAGLADAGLGELTDEYNAANAAQLALTDAQYKLEISNAHLAESFIPVKTDIVNAQAQFNTFLGTLLSAQNVGMNVAQLVKLGLRSSIAAGDEAGLSTQDILDTMDRFGLSYRDLKQAARDADVSLGEYINTLAEQDDEAVAAAEATAVYTGNLEDNNATVEDTMAKLEELRAKYEAIRGGIDSAVGGFDDLTEAQANAATSTDAMIAALDSQIAYMANYTANLQSAADLGLSTTLIEQLSDGSVESAAYLQAIVDDGGASIDALNAKFADVETGKQTFVDTVAALLPEFQAQLDEVTAAMDAAVGEWNLYDEAATSGQNTIAGLLSSVEGNYAAVYAAGVALGNQLVAGYDAAMDQHSPSRRMGREMDYTVDGALIAAQRRLRDMGTAGAELGMTYAGSFQAASQRVQSAQLAGVRAAVVGASSAGAAAAPRGNVEITINPQTMDSAQTDYLVRRLDAILGDAL